MPRSAEVRPSMPPKRQAAEPIRHRRTGEPSLPRACDKSASTADQASPSSCKLNDIRQWRTGCQKNASESNSKDQSRDEDFLAGVAGMRLAVDTINGGGDKKPFV